MFYLKLTFWGYWDPIFVVTGRTISQSKGQFILCPCSLYTTYTDIDKRDEEGDEGSKNDVYLKVTAGHLEH